MRWSQIHSKVRNRWKKFRLQPVRVYCLHHVCEKFDADSMDACDWMDIEEFKTKVQRMQQEGIEFISLSDGHAKISKNIFRFHKYAILTFDDGYASLKEILPWLDEQKIPATLFISGKYLDGKSYRKNSKERYLTKNELWELISPLVEIGSHGWEHTDALKMSIDEFKQSIDQNIEFLHTHPRYVPFHAYTWGKHTQVTDAYLQSQGITPIYMDGVPNYNNLAVIHRVLLK